MPFSFRLSAAKARLTLRWLGIPFVIGITMTGCSTTPALVDEHSPQNFPEVISDPFEPVNRGISSVNEKVLFGVIRPTSRIYRAITPAPARQSVSNFSRNINYPVRLANHLLQGRWQGAGSESLRFLTNTTVGIGGLFDPASHWKIPQSEADSAQTFYKWGWQPNSFVMLPLLGPSDDLHVGGRFADRALEPLSYYPDLWPVNAGITFNRLSNRSERIAHFIEVQSDPYEGLKSIWTYTSKEDPPNWSLNGPQHYPSLQTVNATSVRLDNPRFIAQGRQGSVRLSSTGKKMKFNYWLQKERAPLVYIAPGSGGHRLSANILVIAENLYQNGYSVVTTVSTFHPEFMENAATTAIPAYPAVDCQDLLVYLTEINQTLEKKHSERLGKRALLGLSLGGFQSLYLAANEKRMAPELLRFERYLAINLPVDLTYSNKLLDDYYQAPNRWPASERQERINNALHKATLIRTLPPELQKAPPFDGIESKYLVGLSFRATLRDNIFCSQYRHNMGVLKTPLNKWRREAAYREILNYSFQDYLTSFVLPYYKERGVSSAALHRESNLRTYQRTLRADPRIRIITNKDDFILGSKNLSWLGSTFAGSRLTLFPNGGHIGNIATAPVEKATLNALEGLKSN